MNLAMLVVDLYAMAGNDGEIDHFNGTFDQTKLCSVEETLQFGKNIKIPVYATEIYSGWTCGRIRQHIPAKNMFTKHTIDAFRMPAIREAFCGYSDLVIIGFNMFVCVHETTVGAIEHGLNVITCGELLFSHEVSQEELKKQLGFYKKNTRYFESVNDLLSYLGSNV